MRDPGMHPMVDGDEPAVEYVCTDCHEGYSRRPAVTGHADLFVLPAT